MDLNIAGRTGVVTGASSGIGRGIAFALGVEGVRLTIHGRRREPLDELSREIESAGGPAPHVITCDLLEPDSPVAVAEAALGAWGSVDILVNNAGGGAFTGITATDVDWDHALTLNFIRHRQLTTLVVPGMQAAGWGRVINVTGKSESAKGVNGPHAAKAATHAWAKGLSRDVGRAGITVNCIAPGKIMSDQIVRRYTAEDRAREAAEEIPVGCYGEPADIAHLACFLASPLARYITGAVIPVDGGLRRYQF